MINGYRTFGLIKNDESYDKCPNYREISNYDFALRINYSINNGGKISHG